MIDLNLKKLKSGGLLFAVLFGLTSCKFFKNGETTQAVMIPSFPTVVLEKGTIVVNTDYPAEVVSANDVEVRSRATGYVTKLYVEEGSVLKKGQTILKIDDRDYIQRVMAAEAAVNNANSAVNNAKLEVEKITPLVEKNIVSEFQLKTAKTNLASAEAGLEQARAQYNDAKIALSYTLVTSPVDGVMGTTSFYEGNLVNVGTLITSVAKKGDVYANFAFDEKKLLGFNNSIEGKDFHDRISKIPAVEFVMADGSVYSYKGKLEVTSGLINKNTGSIQLRGVFPNPDNSLRSGSSGIVRFPVEFKDVILVPQKATFELQDKNMVYVFNAKDSTITAKSINIASSTNDTYAVVGGVNDGDIILFEGITKVREGMKIISTPTK